MRAVSSVDQQSWSVSATDKERWLENGQSVEKNLYELTVSEILRRMNLPKTGVKANWLREFWRKIRRVSGRCTCCREEMIEDVATVQKV